MLGAFELSWVDAAGAAGLVGSCVWPLFRTRRSILSVQFISSLCWSTHYILLGAATASLITLLAITQIVTAFPERRNLFQRIVYLATLPLALVACIMSWSGPQSALTALGFLIAAIGRWQTDVTRMRLWYLAAGGLWFSHNLIVHSMFGMTADIVAATNNLRRLYEVRRAARPAPVVDAAPAA